MGEVVCSIIGKAILYIIAQDIVAAAGPLQLRAGQMAGNEAAVEQTIFKKDETEEVLEVDNAFNCLTRQSALHNSFAPPFFHYIVKHVQEIYSLMASVFYSRMEPPKVICSQWECTLWESFL